MGLGGVAIAVPPYVIYPKTAVLGRAGGGNCKFLVLRAICNLCNGIEIDLLYLDGIGKLCNFAAEIQ